MPAGGRKRREKGKRGRDRSGRGKRKKKSDDDSSASESGEDEMVFEREFSFDGLGSDAEDDDNEGRKREVAHGWDFATAIAASARQGIDLDTVISRRHAQIKDELELSSSDEDEEDDEDEEEDNEEDDMDADDSDGGEGPEGDDDSEQEVEGRDEEVEGALEDGDDVDDVVSFEDLFLSSALRRALRKLRFESATPIQRKAIPIALAGRDVLASAVTGSGKTAAFAIPCIEKLMKARTKGGRPEVRVLVLSPTRELAAQTHSMVERLAKYCSVHSSLILGGVPLKTQESELREHPELVVGTPGRILDHIRNSMGVSFDCVEVLVLDEADRLLDLGFAPVIEEIIQYIPRNRQTLLFSATLTQDVAALARLSLNDPAVVKVDALYRVPQLLKQEFVRVRRRNERTRPAMLLVLCRSVVEDGGVIVFCNSKKTVRWLHVVLGLAGYRTCELHSGMTQHRRLVSLQRFRDKDAQFLICTDVASRGLDITGIQTVINYHMPRTIVQYVHRVGRTARAGSKGLAISFVADGDLSVLRTVVSNATKRVAKREIDPQHVMEYEDKISVFATEAAALLREERVAGELEDALEKVERSTKEGASSKSEGGVERTWFQSKAEKRATAADSLEAVMPSVKPSTANDSEEDRPRSRRQLKRLKRELEKQKEQNRPSRKKRRARMHAEADGNGHERALKLAARRMKGEQRERRREGVIESEYQKALRAERKDRKKNAGGKASKASGDNAPFTMKNAVELGVKRKRKPHGFKSKKRQYNLPPHASGTNDEQFKCGIKIILPKEFFKYFRGL